MNILRQTLLFSGATLVLTSIKVYGQDAPDDSGNKKPNILFVTTDYQAGEDIPLETAQLGMPNLNRLTEEGVVFQNHYCTAPISMPSRYTLISGRYPHYHKEWDNMGRWLPQGTPTLMEQMGEAGYHTVGVGKMHFHPWERMAGFDKRIIADRKGNGAGDTTRQDGYYHHLKKAGLTRWDYLKKQSESKIYGVYHWPFADSLHIDAYVGDQGARYLKQKKGDQPWFMWLSFNGPHNPWDPPKEYTEPYLEADLPEVNRVPGELQQHPYDITALRYNYTRAITDYLDQYPSRWEETIHRIRAGHYGNLSFIDHQLGKTIQALKETGELANTIIIYSSDHGTHLGDHNLIHKGTPYEQSARVPFVVWWPEKLKPGVRSGFSSHVDLMPTLLDLAGSDIPEELEGESLVDMITGKEEGDDHAIVEIRQNYTWVTHDWLFGIFPPTQEEILIHRAEDPGEHFNVINNPEYKHIADSLRRLLYDFHPPIRKQFQNGSPLEVLPQSLTLNPGDTLQGRNNPYLGGRAWKMQLHFDYSQEAEGPLFTFHEGRAHGLSAFVCEGHLHLGFRTWGEDQILKLKDDLPEGKVSCSITLNKEGKVKASINGQHPFKESTDWPMPLQSGRKHYLTGAWYTASAGSRWVQPLGNYQHGDTYSDSIQTIQIQLK